MHKVNFIIFSSNDNKIKECRRIFNNVYKYTDFVEAFNVLENGNTFSQNSKIKLLALKNKIDQNILNKYILMAEDSGICIEYLNNKPGIYSSRYANIHNFTSKKEIENAKECNSDENINKVINELNKIYKTSSKAYFISCISIYVNNRIYTVHGFLHGRAINERRGNNGFGYDSIFIPNGYENTLGELEDNIKDNISHRSKALELVKLLVK